MDCVYINKIYNYEIVAINKGIWFDKAKQIRSTQIGNCNRALYVIVQMFYDIY